MPNLIPITPEQFASKAWTRGGFAFAQKDHLIPFVLAELAQLVPVMPLAFVPLGEGYQAVGLASLQPGSSLYVSPDGQWLAEYVPAALRTYPFRLAKAPGRDGELVCFDTDSGRLAEAGQGEAFYDPAGEPTQTVKDIIALLAQVGANRIATQTAVDALHAAGIIQPWKLAIKDGERTMNVEGLSIVDEARFAALPDDVFVGLRPSGALGLAYAQLMSLSQLNRFARLASVQRQLQSQRAPQPLSPAPALGGITASLGDDGNLKFH